MYFSNEIYIFLHFHIYFCLQKKLFSVKQFFNINFFFPIKTFFSANNVCFVKNNLVLQKMNNHKYIYLKSRFGFLFVNSYIAAANQKANNRCLMDECF